MKINLIFGLLIGTTINLVTASPSSGQSIHTTSITMEFHQETLKEALLKLQEASGYTIFYPSEKIEQTGHIEIKKETRSIAQTLDLLLKNTALSYDQNGKNIVLYSEIRSIDQAAAPVKIQSIKVSGIVTDENGGPLSGVSVVIKNWRDFPSLGQSSTATDENGHFSLTVPSEQTVIVFSFMGYTSLERIVGPNHNIQIRLQQDTEAMEEVVVTGYQSINKERATGSFSVVTAEDLESKRANSLSTLLEGEIAGYTDGLVRGTTSMNGMTNPLFVIDGFPVENTRYASTGHVMESLPQLNLEDIASITVLKDAAAASIYGARAARRHRH